MSYHPVILLGNGIRNDPKLIEHLCSLDIPILLTWMACDLLPEDHPAYCGRPGILGQRAANIIQQKATHLYCFSARLDGEQVFYDYDAFAPNAEIYVYDVDEAELQKFPLRYHTTTRTTALIDPAPPEWLAWCKALYARFRPELDGKPTGDKYVDPFVFINLLSEYSSNDDVLAIGSSGNPATTFLQTYKVKQGQRVSNVCSIGCMGADIPMALGAAVATGRRTICVTGDGGFAMNAQELETIRRLRLPVIFFVFNNDGYASISNNQDIRFNGHRVGSDPKSGLTLPYIEDIATAYRIPYYKLDGYNLSEFSRCFNYAPLIVEVLIDPAWAQYPRAMARRVDGVFYRDDMSDMTPKIDDLQELMNWECESLSLVR